jgi:hypothetical protein
MLPEILLLLALCALPLVSRSDQNWPFYVVCGVLLWGIAAFIARWMVPVCSDGSLVGEALIRACG